jgi:hypothetical protein
MIKFTVLGMLAFVCMSSSRAHACVEIGDIMRPNCGIRPSSAKVVHTERRARRIEAISQTAVANVLSHPEGCPSRAFCGCGAAVRLFGKPVRALWLAANWLKFPRAEARAGMVAVRRHHVMVLEADLGGGNWQVYDANSGRGLTRVHARSLAGYAIVNPSGGA